jgi:hypothetical protein
MEALCSSETLVITNGPFRCSNPDDQNFPEIFSFFNMIWKSGKFEDCKNAVLEKFLQGKLPVRSIIIPALYQFRATNA